MEEEGLTLSKFREPLLKDLPFLYVFGILTALAHLTGTDSSKQLE
jgi:hypothetical protein